MRPVPALLLIVIATAAAVGWLWTLPFERAKAITAEGGPIEVASVLGWVLAALVAAWRLRGAPRIAAALLLLILAARELDLDKRAFTQGLFKSRQYFGGDVPAGEIALSVLVLVAIVAVVAVLVRHGARPFADGLRARRTWPWALVLAIAVALVAKALDGIARKAAGLGIELPATASAYAAPAE